MKKRGLIVILILILAATGLLAVKFISNRDIDIPEEVLRDEITPEDSNESLSKEESNVAQNTSQGEINIPKELGSKKAKIKIVYYCPPSSCQQPVIDLLKNLVKKYNGKIYVEFQNPQGCAGLVINGKQTFKLKGREVELSKSPGMNYTVPDLKQIIEMEIKRVYT